MRGVWNRWGRAWETFFLFGLTGLRSPRYLWLLYKKQLLSLKIWNTNDTVLLWKSKEFLFGFEIITENNKLPLIWWIWKPCSWGYKIVSILKSNKPGHEVSNSVACATSKASDQPAHMWSLIRAFASRLNILGVLSYWLNIIWIF